ncbi:MAG: MBL fold metallo-hydrolase [Sphaerochaeta sp.]|nr:MBL fold metallo-hydrolase [Sphaerochaeta sp.]MCH3920374.1 MBL fold metallo-hydrolase [Sphaerochaeta sp.]MCI2044981.1 MBL fold metallo-hydrolase [Sphaerochaeta sp.]MCI2096520.1 MBL fold metallo-hydrolase [Sphaerochaeta sp.]
MQITFIGAARHVTGSCTLLECGGKRILIDCGMPQGNDERDMGDQLPFRAAMIDAVLLTHAHIDHSGWLPLLYKEGFRGAIWSTEATADLCEIMLADSGHIQEMEAEWRDRKAMRGGGQRVEPIYTAEDAAQVMSCFRESEYGQLQDLGGGVRFRFVDAGHLLGSASIEVWLEEQGQKRKMVFSGDVGNFDQPLIKDPHYLDDADYVMIESTYGDRLHQLPPGAVGHNVPNIVRAKELAEIVRRTFGRGGNVIIPAFAVGRTQEILYLFRLINFEHLCPEYPGIPVFVDSPLSVKATGVFAANVEGYFDSEAMELVNKGVNPLTFPSLVAITDVADSKMLNSRKEPCVIISSSGMCEAGRIRHHLKHNLWRKECTVVFSGFQAQGTLGRSILDGARHVTLFGEQVDVNCEIRNLEGISGHADRDGLVAWLKAFKTKPRMVFVNHGEDETAEAFSYYVQTNLGMKSYAPLPMEHYDLLDEASFPSGKAVDETELPYYRDLLAAVSELDKQHRTFEGVLHRLQDAANQKNIQPKDAVQLQNTLTRLASDLEFLTFKWGKDCS